MKRIRFTGFTLLLTTVLMVTGAPARAGGFQLSRAMAANPFTQLLDTAAELWHRLMAAGPAERSGVTRTKGMEKADPTPPPPAGATTSGGGIIPGGGCIDPNGVYIC